MRLRTVRKGHLVFKVLAPNCVDTMQTSALAFYLTEFSAMAGVAWLVAQPLWLRWQRSRLRAGVFPAACLLYTSDAADE